MQNVEKIQLKDGHYEIPLPFKNNVGVVPNKKLQALARIGWLTKKLEKDHRLCDDYKVFMKELVAKGYACKVPAIRMNPKEVDAWYRPHHGV